MTKKKKKTKLNSTLRELNNKPKKKETGKGRSTKSTGRTRSLLPKMTDVRH